MNHRELPDGALESKAMLRETDYGRENEQRDVARLSRKTERKRRKYDGDMELPESSTLTHPGESLHEVMRDVLKEHPEESFAFLDESKLRRRVAFLQERFVPEMGHVTYAVKANPRRQILAILLDAGLHGFDCASAREIERVRQIDADVPIYFNHPVKTHKDIVHALGQGVEYYAVEEEKDVSDVVQTMLNTSTTFPDLEMAVRMQTPNDAAKINLSSKFGASPEETLHLLRAIRSDYGMRPSIAIHTGSQNTSPLMFDKGIKAAAAIAREAGGISSLNIGGGLPVNYHPHENYNLEEFMAVISQSVRDSVKGVFKDDPRFILELGRAIIAEAVDLAIPVLKVNSQRGERRITIADGVFTSFIDSKIHKWEYYFEAVDAAIRPLEGRSESAQLYGRTCDCGDKLGETMLPENVSAGDYLHVRNAGAYLDSQASYFNGFPPPRYVMYGKKPIL